MPRQIILIGAPSDAEMTVFIASRPNLSDASPISYVKRTAPLTDGRAIMAEVPDTHAIVLVPKMLCERMSTQNQLFSA